MKIKIPQDPGEWQDFVKREDNIELFKEDIIKLKEKYRDEKLLFERVIYQQEVNQEDSDEDQQQIISPAVSGPIFPGTEGKKPPIPDPFHMRIVVPSSNFTMKVNISKDSAATDYNIDWGDGTEETGNAFVPAHVYAAPGTYDIKIHSAFDHMTQMFGGVTPPMSATIQHVFSWGGNVFRTMSKMFALCTGLQSVPAGAPNLSQCTSLESMFLYTTSFNQDLNHWDVSNIEDLTSTFNTSTSFNGNISNWDTSNVTSMLQTFDGANSFNQDLSGWVTNKVTSMNQMFNNCHSFDSNLSSWDTSSVTEMARIFSRARVFTNGGDDGIRYWDVSGVSDFNQVFQDARLFNQPLDGWNVMNATTMDDMFQSAESFNQDISMWNVSNVTHMQNMFDGASVFSQNLGGWDITNLKFVVKIFFNSGMTTANYDHLLTGWSTATRQTNVVLNTDLTYSAAAEAARNTLIATPWTIIDGGLV